MDLSPTNFLTSMPFLERQDTTLLSSTATTTTAEKDFHFHRSNYTARRDAKSYEAILKAAVILFLVTWITSAGTTRALRPTLGNYRPGDGVWFSVTRGDD